MLLIEPMAGVPFGSGTADSQQERARVEGVGAVVAFGFLGWSGPLNLQPSSGLWWLELLQRFTQLEPDAGGVCEEESALRNKPSILDLRSASRLVSFLSCSVSCSMS
jgi:hypothetical protein